MTQSLKGRVLTFYSFKGGTGRSMALANVASILANRNGGQRVLAIDWDLEAPGLHRYFRPYIRVSGPVDRDSEIEGRPGLIELLSLLRGRLSGASEPLERDDLMNTCFAEVDLREYTLQTDIPGLQFVKAGRFDSSYSAKIRAFEWESLYTSQPSFFGAFADYLVKQYDFVLIDSRTGFTDISGICTALMPDTLVAVFTPNRQSLSGVLDVIKQASGHRARSDDLRSFRVFPLVSRVELSELKLNDAWRFGDTAEDIKGYQPEFEAALTEMYSLTGCDLTAYFDEAQVQYVPYYAFGEKIAVRSEESATRTLGRSYATFSDMLASSTSPWEFQARTQDEASRVEVVKEVPWDEEWFANHRAKALIGLEKAGKTAAMEVRFSLSHVKAASSRRQLLDVARGAQIHTFGWPIGIVFEREDFKPRPAADGIYAEVANPDGSYDYWCLRQDGDFFLLRSLFEDERGENVIFFDIRIIQVTEALLYCKRLYERLEVSPRAEVRVVIEHSGLAGRSLASADRGRLRQPRGPTEVDRSRASTECVLGRIESDLLELVKHFVEPLFEIFDIELHLQDLVYQGLIEKFRSGHLG
jgi:CobQ/CobB/MinD/ParA nucleotide binding domain